MRRPTASGCTTNPRASGKLKLDPRDSTVRVPTLVLWGEKDQALLPPILVNAQIRRFIEKEHA